MAMRTYLAVTDYDPSTRNWVIFLPAFPWVHSWSPTAAELLQTVRDAIATAVEALEDDGEELPRSLEDGEPGEYVRTDFRDPRAMYVSVETRGKPVAVDVSLEESLLARLDAYSEQRGLSRSEAIAQAVRSAIANDASR
jgi:predicted RNase H-like HicB family nuclease